MLIASPSCLDTHNSALRSICCCRHPPLLQSKGLTVSQPSPLVKERQLYVRSTRSSSRSATASSGFKSLQTRIRGSISFLAQQPRALVGAGAVGLACSIALLAQASGAGSGGGQGPQAGAGGGGGSGDSPGAGNTLQVPGRDDQDAQKPKLPPVSLTLVSFAVTRKAYQRITERFAKEYEAATGQFVKFRLSFGGSGTQARALVDGLPGDIVALALPLDVQKIADAGLIEGDWKAKLPNGAVVAESVVALVTRKGNPKNIRGWDDLVRDDVQVITANPKTAGVARWNFLALWGHRLKRGEPAALDYVTKVFERVPVQPRDAREASDVFYKQNLGDVLLNYENEVRLTNSTYGENALPYIVPDNNVMIETPIAVVDKNVRQRSARTRDATVKAAHAFAEYLFTPGAQQDYADVGFRVLDPALRSTSKLPSVKDIWKVEERLGSWDSVQAKFFGAGGVLDDIQRHVGEKRRKEREAQSRRKR